MNKNAIDDASRQGAISDGAGAISDGAGAKAEGAGAMTDRGGAASGFSWERWQEKIERLCRLAEMCADDESTLKAFKRRVGWESGQAGRGDGESLLAEPAVGREGKGGGLAPSESLLTERAVGREGKGGELAPSGSLLTERAVLAGVSAEEVWHRRSSVSLGGACRMMFSADGVVAVNLPRDYDWQMLPALFGMFGLDDVGLRLDEFGLYEVGRDYVGGDEAVPAWEAACQTLESAVARLPTEDLVCAAGELGLAVAEVRSSRYIVGSSRYSDILAASPQTASTPIAPIATGSSGATSSASSAADSFAATFNDSHGGSVSLPPLPQTGRPLRDTKVVDLSVMWAGPLCGDLLARAGAQVVKVESSSRPDGARRGLPEFYELLNGQKQHRSIGFDASEGRAELLGLLQNADIVITSCRPRALEQMGIDPLDVVRQSGVIWAGITGYGWEQGHKVAFGDDAAAAGGLVRRAGRSPQEAELASGDAADHFENTDGLSSHIRPARRRSDVADHFESEGELSERKRGRESSEGILPCFIGDAMADPLTGVTAAAAVMEQWLSETPGFLDISMVGSAAFFCEED